MKNNATLLIGSNKNRNYNIKNLIEKIRNENKKLIIANQSKSSFLKNISHDLKNYVYGINSLLEMLLESKINKSQDLGEEDELKFLDLAVRSSKEMSYFLQDFLDNEQFENGLLNDLLKLNNITDCNLNDIIERVVIFNKANLLQSKITIKTIITDNLPQIKFDEKRLKQILINLIGNAIKYSNSNTVIIVKSDYLRENNEIMIAICDQGIGMTEAEITMALSGKGIEIEKIGLDKNYHCNGIGLLASKQLMEASKGRINIISKKNKGTIIELFFKV